jgi:hypothetical protein
MQGQSVEETLGQPLYQAALGPDPQQSHKALSFQIWLGLPAPTSPIITQERNQ